MRTAHTYQITALVGKGLFGIFRSANPAKSHNWYAACGYTHLLMNFKEMPWLKIHVRHMIFQTQTEITLTIGKVINNSIRG